MKRYQQHFHERRICGERRKAAIRQMHQLSCILIDTDAAGTGITRHRRASIGSEHSGESLPANEVALQDTDSGGVSPAELDGRLRQFLKHVARVRRHFGGKHLHCPMLPLVIGRALRPRAECRTDIDLLESCSGVGKIRETSGTRVGERSVDGRLHRDRSPFFESIDASLADPGLICRSTIVRSAHGISSPNCK